MGMTRLRRAANGQDCTLRLPGGPCDPETVVLAHLRRNGWGGMSTKPHDLLAVFACHRCHALQEARDPCCTDTDLLRALGETILRQIDMGNAEVRK